MTSTASPLTQIVSRDRVPEAGLELDIEASGDKLKALAAFLQIPAVENLSAHYTITPWRGQGLAVKGTVKAHVVQTCVVTLEPVHNSVSEDVETYFTPDAGGRAAPKPDPAVESPEVDLEELIDRQIDIGAITCEHLAIGLEPYPRKPGATFESDDADGNGPEQGAFASLAALRNTGHEK